MNTVEAALRVLTSEWPMDMEVTDQIRAWLEGKEANGEDPGTWAEGMAIKVRTLKDQSNPAGFILYSIRERKDDYTSLAPRQSYEASKVRDIVKKITASTDQYTHAQLMEIHARGGIPWTILSSFYSTSYVARAFTVLREHARDQGFQDIRVTNATPTFYDGEWTWQPVPTNDVAESGAS